MLMKNLLPHFILENYKNNVFRGSFEGYALFSDITGFSSISTRLMNAGNEGAEILSELLRNVFAPSVNHVYDHNGFVTNFAGDGFISIFNDGEKDCGSNAMESACKLIKELESKKNYKTRLGSFKIKSKIGLSYGTINWAVVGDQYKSFYFKGPAISGCSKSKDCASENEIIIDKAFLEKCNIFSDSKYQLIQKGRNHFSAVPCNFFHSKESPQNGFMFSGIANEIFSRKFFPKIIFGMEETGEFRNVVSVFISFDMDLAETVLEKLFRVVLESMKANNAYHKDIDFGDKGGVIVSFFGVPVSSGSDVSYALKSINSIYHEMSHDADLKNVRLKIGITSGKAYAGFMGGIHREQYSVIGNMVNLAARLMVAAKEKEILVNEEVANAIRGNSEFAFVDQMRFKGFDKLVPVFRYNGTGRESTEDRAAFHTAVGKKSSFQIVGRERELDFLDTKVREILDLKTGGVIYVIGEAGIGKSTLLKEFKKVFTENKSVNWLHCRTSETLKDSLSPFKYLLKNFFDQSSANSTEVNKLLFENNIEILLKRLENLSMISTNSEVNVLQMKEELQRTKSVLGAMVELEWEGSLYQKLDPGLRFENSLLAICNLIFSLCILKPVIIEIEDIHWLDKQSVELLKMLLSNVSQQPLAVICTSRYLTQDKKVSRTSDYSIPIYELQLDYFDVTRIKEFGKVILGDEISSLAAELIEQNTNGNPYFVEQMFFDLKERNLWKKKKNTFSLRNFSFEDIPDSISNVLITRFDRLPIDVKEVVKIASVLGREFDYSIIKDVCVVDKLDTKIDLALRHNIFSKNDNGRLIFTHSLLRDAVYGMQLPTDRNKHHLSAADAFKRAGGKKPSTAVLEKIAFHTGIGKNIIDYKNKIIFGSRDVKSEDFTKTVKSYIEMKLEIAGKLKRDFRNEKAFEVYQSVYGILQYLKELKPLMETLSGLIELSIGLSKLSNARKYLSKMFLFSKKVSDISIKINYYRLKSNVYYDENNYEQCLKTMDFIEEKWKDNVSPAFRIELFNLRGKIYREKGLYNKSIEIYDNIIKLANQSHFKIDKAKAYHDLSILCRITGELNRSGQFIDKSIKALNPTKNKNHYADFLRAKGNLALMKGEYGSSINCYKNSIKIFEEIGNRNSKAHTLGNMGNAYLEISMPGKAEECFNEQLRIFRETDNQLGTEIAYSNLASLCISQGKLDTAYDYYTHRQKISKKLMRMNSIAESYSNIAIIFSMTGKFKRALITFKKQIDLDRKADNKAGVIRGLLNMAITYYKAEDYKSSLKCFEEIFIKNRNFHLNKDYPVLLIEYSNVLLKSGKYDEAQENLKKLKTSFLSERTDLTSVAQIVKNKVKLCILLNRNGGNRLSVSKKIDEILLTIEKEINHLQDPLSKLEEFIELYELIGKYKDRINIESQLSWRIDNRCRTLFKTIPGKEFYGYLERRFRKASLI